MTFPNAYKGVKKIHLGQILAIIAGIAMLAAVLIVAIKGGENAEEISEELLGPVAILMLVSGILAIIGMIITIVGLVNGKIDEPAFMTALIMVLLSIILSAIDSFYLNEKYATASKFVSAAQSVLQLASTVFVIKGIMNLAGKLDRPDMVEKGKKTMSVILVVSIIAIICELLTGFFSLGETLANIVAVVEICASVLALVYLIIYIIYLGKAKKMLEA